MITRLYANNFRCLVAFTAKFDSFGVVCGPNGAGKTTAAYNLLPDVFNTVEFVNADEIARGLSPFNFEGVTLQAARIMIGRLHTLLTEKKSFAFETTLAGLTYLA